MNGEIRVKKFPMVNSSNEDIAKVTLEHLWADLFALKIKVFAMEAVPSLGEVIQKALLEASKLKARLVMFRLIKGETGYEEIVKLLPKIGFKKKSERIEFKKTVADLPSDEGTPLRWKTAEDLGWKPQDIAETLKQASIGDPDTDPSEDPLMFIQDFLADPVLTSGLHCIHVGFFESEVAALTVIQLNPKTGWSRISYMGVLPKFRKQKLGLWVHRYSFKIMKAFGGLLYHGGTTSTNLAMIRLFEKNGCTLFCEMEEWNYSVEGGTL